MKSHMCYALSQLLCLASVPALASKEVTKPYLLLTPCRVCSYFNTHFHLPCPEVNQYHISSHLVLTVPCHQRWPACVGNCHDGSGLRKSRLSSPGCWGHRCHLPQDLLGQPCIANRIPPPPPHLQHKAPPIARRRKKQRCKPSHFI